MTQQTFRLVEKVRHLVSPPLLPDEASRENAIRNARRRAKRAAAGWGCRELCGRVRINPLAGVCPCCGSLRPASAGLQ